MGYSLWGSKELDMTEHKYIKESWEGYNKQSHGLDLARKEESLYSCWALISSLDMKTSFSDLPTLFNLGFCLLVIYILYIIQYIIFLSM